MKDDRHTAETIIGRGWLDGWMDGLPGPTDQQTSSLSPPPPPPPVPHSMLPLGLLSTRYSQSLVRNVALPGHRSISLLAALPAVLVPPVVFGGLLLSLWTYKCAMMVLLQNKIIYMPGVPLGAKREILATYRHLCGTIQWNEHHRALRTSDGKLLSTVTASTLPVSGNIASTHIFVVYFQGNASSTPPRLPYLSAVLAAASTGSSTRYSFLVPSYRGYWTSTGRPSQRGIEKDLVALFTHLDADPDARVILWGQSIGCGIALTGWAKYLSSRNNHPRVNVVGLVLETPFVSVSNMLRVLYPQRWLPYRYLSPFLWNSWDVREAVKTVGGMQPRVLVVRAEKDEIVPVEETDEVEGVVRSVLGDVRSVVVKGALHEQCVSRPYGRGEIVAFLKGFEK